MPDKEPLELRQAALKHLLEGEYKHFISYGSGDWRDLKKSKSGNTPPFSLSLPRNMASMMAPAPARTLLILPQGFGRMPPIAGPVQTKSKTT